MPSVALENMAVERLTPLTAENFRSWEF